MQLSDFIESDTNTILYKPNIAERVKQQHVKDNADIEGFKPHQIGVYRNAAIFLMQAIYWHFTMSGKAFCKFIAPPKGKHTQFAYSNDSWCEELCMSPKEWRQFKDLIVENKTTKTQNEPSDKPIVTWTNRGSITYWKVNIDVAAELYGLSVKDKRAATVGDKKEITSTETTPESIDIKDISDPQELGAERESIASKFVRYWNLEARLRESETLSLTEGFTGKRISMFEERRLTETDLALIRKLARGEGGIRRMREVITAYFRFVDWMDSQLEGTTSEQRRGFDPETYRNWYGFASAVGKLNQDNYELTFEEFQHQAVEHLETQGYIDAE